MSTTTSVYTNRPVVKTDGNLRPIYASVDDLAFRGDYTSTNLIYKGFARPGSDTSSPVWQIAFITYDGSNNITAVQWPLNASGAASSEYEFIWDNRADYTFV